MSVNSIGGSSPYLSMMTAAQSNIRKPGGGEANETAAQESKESPKVQAAEGEAGGIVNTYA